MSEIMEACAKYKGFAIPEEIVDCKIVSTLPATVLYLKGRETDYGIKLYDDIVNFRDTTKLEKFKIFKMSEIMQSYAEYKVLAAPEVLDIKPTYEAEGEALIESGLLQGNENGLDPLKPLTRIEVTTILVRALGLEDEPAQAEPAFSDIEPGSWGVKYANIAAAKGLSNGIGDGKFAPDALVTDNQFAALLLRSVESDAFDWQTAIQLLIEKGIITAEDAQTMDLFTRGDMAKIIYEAKQKGLLQ
jgi:hypothetical protein